MYSILELISAKILYIDTLYTLYSVMYPGQLGNQCTGNNFQVFIFQVYFNKKYIEVGTQKTLFKFSFFKYISAKNMLKCQSMISQCI